MLHNMNLDFLIICIRITLTNWTSLQANCYQLIIFNKIYVNFRNKCKMKMIIFWQIKVLYTISDTYWSQNSVLVKLSACGNIINKEMIHCVKFRNIQRDCTFYSVLWGWGVGGTTEACSPWWIYYKQLLSYCFNVIHFWVCVWWLTPALFSKDQHILLTLK